MPAKTNLDAAWQHCPARCRHVRRLHFIWPACSRSSSHAHRPRVEKILSSIFFSRTSCRSGRWPSCGKEPVQLFNAVTGTSNGLLAALFSVNMPIWWCKGLFQPRVLGLHYAPFAHILIMAFSATWTQILKKPRPFSTRPRKPCSALPFRWSSSAIIHHSAGLRQRDGPYPVPHIRA